MSTHGHVNTVCIYRIETVRQLAARPRWGFPPDVQRIAGSASESIGRQHGHVSLTFPTAGPSYRSQPDDLSGASSSGPMPDSLERMLGMMLPGSIVRHVQLLWYGVVCDQFFLLFIIGATSIRQYASQSPLASSRRL